MKIKKWCLVLLSILMIGFSGNEYQSKLATNVPVKIQSNKCKFQYKVLNKKAKTATIIKVDNPRKVVKIPKTIDGYMITQIGISGEQRYEYESGVSEANGQIFNKLDRESVVVEVKIPKGVKVIGRDAFRECVQLRKINFPKKLVYIRESAFYGCESLKVVVLPKSLKGVGVCAFSSCEGIQKLVVNSNKVYIGENAFSTDGDLHTIQFPKKFYGKLYEHSLSGYSGKKFIWINFLRSDHGISEGFLYGAYNLEEVRIPSRIKDAVIGLDAISTDKIDRVVVSTGVKIFSLMQQSRNLSKVIIKGKNTVLEKDNITGNTDSNYMCTSTIIGPKGSKAEKFAKDCYYPSSKKLEDEHIDVEYTEHNFIMKKVKFIGIKIPKKVKYKKTKKNLKWTKDKIAFGYKVYYSKSKKGTYKKISTTKNTTYITKKKGYYKVRAYRIDYGEDWDGSSSKVKYIG